MENDEPTNIHILLAEDDDDHAELVIYSLEQASMTLSIDHVTDGEQVIQYLKQEGEFKEKPRPSVLLLDLNMPKLNGLEVLERIKSAPEFSDIPAIMLTTSDAETDRAKAYQNHVNSYLVKPMDFAEFEKMLSTLCDYWGKWNRPSVNTSHSHA